MSKVMNSKAIDFVAKSIERIMNGPTGWDTTEGTVVSTIDSLSANSHRYDPYIAMGNAVQTTNAVYSLLGKGTPIMTGGALVAAAGNIFMSKDKIVDEIEQTGSFKASSVTDLIGDSIIFMSSALTISCSRFYGGWFTSKELWAGVIG